MHEIKYYYGKELCTLIRFSTPNDKIEFINYTDNLLHRAFGVKKSVTWQDLEDFLESRCIPRERDGVLQLLKENAIPYYDPWLIVEKTHGRMAEDDAWLEVIYNSE